jgi:hypothetical protein
MKTHGAGVPRQKPAKSAFSAWRNRLGNKRRTSFLQGLKPHPAKRVTPGLKPRPPKEKRSYVGVRLQPGPPFGAGFQLGLPWGVGS